MSFAFPLVLAFSQSQFASSVEERIKGVTSALLYLRREGVSAVCAVTKKPTCLENELAPFLSPAFYQAVDTKRAALNGGEAQVPTGRHGLREIDYIFSGSVVRVALNEDQQAVIRDLGFDIR